ncbi:hypothetical protein BH92_27490 (plasmid) [Rhodococcoides fascians A21d2]|uniref:hypothetical protein n=1 Tax=Rhodococcoides fascians TaxID=1828 RepID=UPI0005684641|nr:hypothetical protein [Rhodococcus fascians]QII03642.1 hypothetical protein BH92_27490 [Rhodococcus fascians A21d2]
MTVSTPVSNCGNTVSPLVKLNDPDVHIDSRFVEVDGMSVHHRRNGSEKPVLLFQRSASASHGAEAVSRLLEGQLGRDPAVSALWGDQEHHRTDTSIA